MHGRILKSFIFSLLLAAVSFAVVAEPSQQDIDDLRALIRLLEDKAKAVKDASSDDQVKTNARAIERIANVAKTLGVELDDQVDDAPGPVDPPVDPTDPPIDPPPPGTGFTEVDWTGSIDLPKTATLADIQSALNTDKPVRIAAGTTYTGRVNLPDAVELLGVHGVGARPVIISNEAGEKLHGIDITGDKIERVVIQGLRLRGPDDPAKEQAGIHIGFGTGEGRYAKQVIIEDCEISHYFWGVAAGDSYSRANAEKDDAGKPIAPGAVGRITITIRRNIIHTIFGDKLAAGIYLEGTVDSVVEENTIDHTGWDQGKPEQRSVFGHGMYCQDLNQPIIVRNNWISRTAGHALQLRAGGTISGNVVSGCSLGIYMDYKGGLVDRNVVIDQVDISETQGRGHAYTIISTQSTVKGNIAARKGGSMANMRAFNSLQGDVALSGNRAIAWAPTNFEIAGTSHANIGTNKTIDTDPGLPKYTDALRTRHLTRPRGAWDSQYETGWFITRSKQAITPPE